ncbi:MAG: hypothetical protein M3Z66_06780 [Chloroflexota bacterium]|nr:hypothetical protein [Chloroflexota bacterium]
MIKSFRAEWVKLMRRPIVIVLMLFATVYTILGYAVQYADIIALHAGGANVSDPFLGISSLLLPQLVPFTVASLFSSGTPADTAAVAALILGCIVVGSDYPWGTLKTALTQQPGRLAIYGGQVLALFATITVLLLPQFGGATAGSVLIALLAHHSIQAPSLPGLGRALAFVWLIMAAWAAFGVLMATIARGPGIAMGIGIAWLQVVEGMIQIFAAHSAVVQAIVRWLPQANTDALARGLSP